jgi:beta-xylosidase
MNVKILFPTLSALFLLAAIGWRTAPKKQGTTGTQSLTYTNPIILKYLADPYMRFEDGYYYLFATGGAEDGNYIPIHRSKDLSHWQFVRGAVKNGAKTDWNYMHFWAPEVYKINGKFYMYYTASPEDSPENSGNHVGLAIADSIQGPYKNAGVVIPHSSIDGHVFFDTDNSMYLFYTIEHGNKDGLTAGQIYCDRLLSPTKVEGKPKQIISQHEWQEGTFMLHRNNKYFLTYSLGNWRDSTYRVCYSIATSPLGPYTEQPNVILKSNKMVKGAGHHSFFQDKTGKDWIVYHGWDTAFVARYPRIDRIFVAGDKITSDGPTVTPQSITK